MPRTILCQKCGIVLNLPDHTPAGKRLKCPRCAHRFQLTEQDASAESTLAGPADAMASSTREFGTRPPSVDDLPVASGDRDLRDLFELPSGTADSIEHAAAGDPRRSEGDAAALFQAEPARRKKPRGAEARAQARRCVVCGSVVPAGMSLCPACGVDQETGLRVDLTDDLIAPPPPRAAGPPLHIAVIGVLAGLGSLALLVIALANSARVEPGVLQYCWLCLAVVSAVGIFGAIQFFVGKTPKYLMLALTLGLFVDIVALIAVPIIQANFEEREVIATLPVPTNDPEEEPDAGIKPIAERIDQSKITTGLVVIGLYGVISLYLMSPPVKKYFTRRAIMDAGPLV
ncbi:hypothetical protein OJF2_18150 [Aquisphaera giovannonii]|uniref:Uncharacterized protein n=1 Tax=Aquisphaera giovannonii TaxID=406548 RepID=A0A5B9VZE7_9BACT|nr:hypothetical protein [Aquisphaera giovannonii]QEH33314.1 hypothetical protein OJF2_18150 [Aquisphaera giovannonii]